jgi:electron transfer flavoprotein alpha subunit
MTECIFAFGQCLEGKLHPASLEILTPLREVADRLNKRLILIGLADDKEKFLAIPELKTLLADEVWYITHPNLKHLPDDLCERVLVYLAIEHKPYGIFFPATKKGLSVAPRVAGSLQAGLCAHVNAFEIKDGNLFLLRPTYGENIIAKLTSLTLPIMATVALNAFPIKEAEKEPLIKEIKLPEGFDWSTKLTIKNFKPAKKEPSRLSVAKVVVAGGMGLKSKENFQMLFELAKILNAEVGGTRPAVHAGWVEADRMIGVSGVSVRPKLYLAFGITGAIQHTVGMEGSEFIVSINIDKEAPMMKMAHVGFVCDAPSFLKALLRKLKAKD